jgi:hypothetical protein
MKMLVASLICGIAAPALADVRLKNTSNSFAHMTPTVAAFTKKPTSLQIPGSVDMVALRQMLGGRAIAKGTDAIKVITQHPNGRGEWHEMRSSVQVVDVESSTKKKGVMGEIDFNDASVRTAPFLGFAHGLFPDDRLAVHQQGVASRLEINMADGSRTTIDLEDFGNNTRPLRAFNR